MIRIVSSRSASQADQELRKLTQELDLGDDAEELIAKGRQVSNTVTAGIDLSSLADEDDSFLLDDEDEPVTDEDTLSTQDALVQLLDAYTLLMPSAQRSHLEHLAAALGMTSDETEAFILAAEQILRPDGDLLGGDGGAEQVGGDDEDADLLGDDQYEDEDDDLDTDGDAFMKLIGAGTAEEPDDADDEDWEDVDASTDDPFLDQLAALPNLESPQDALADDNDFDLSADDLDELKDDAEMPVTASIVTATEESEELKEDLMNDGAVGPDDANHTKEGLMDDGEPIIFVKKDPEYDNDGELPTPRSL